MSQLQSPTTSPSATGEHTLSSFRILAGLGEGGMARVFLVVNKRGNFEKLLVLKVLRGELGNDSEFHDMFMQEARIAARLNHPNVVQTYEVGEDDGKLFIAMEYLEGHALSTVIKTAGRDKFPLAIGVQMLADALQGLHYAHELTSFDGTPLDLVHRDVSPQNLFVLFTGDTKIVDFGIAKVAGGAVHTRTGVIKGKLGYMAPEQIHGKSLDRRADIFSIGVMLWEMLAGRRLVQSAEDDVAALARRMEGADPSVRTVAPPDAPEELLAICERAMAGNPDDRYATALEFHDALNVYLTAQRVTRRSVSAFMQEHFREERSKVQKLIERQLNDEHSAPLDINTERAIPGLFSSSDLRAVGSHDVDLTNMTAVTVRPGKKRPWWMVAIPCALLGAGGALLYVNATSAPQDLPTTSLLPAVASSAPPALASSAAVSIPTPIPSASVAASSAPPDAGHAPEADAPRHGARGVRGQKPPAGEKPVPAEAASARPGTPRKSGRHGIDEADPYQ